MPASDFDSAKLVVGLGAARTGTAWMSAYFSKHPDVLMSPLRVLHYFDVRYQPEEYGFHEERFAGRLHSRTPKASGANDTELDALRDRVEMLHQADGFLHYFRKRWSG